MATNIENDDIDEDIQRLQIVLQDDEENEAESDAEGELQSLHQDAEDEHRSFMSRSRPSTCSDVTASSYPPTSVGPEGEDRYQLLDPNNANPESCLAMNRAYQEVLLDLLRQTEMSLNENRLKQKQLEEDIEKMSSGGKQTGYKTSGKSFASVNVPYFKDQDGHCPPDNADVQAKKDLQEAKQHVRPQTAWSKFARKKLISAVAMDTLEKMLRPVMSRLELESEKMRQCKNDEEIDACKDRIETLKEEIENKRTIPEKELIQNVDADKVDWMKISIAEFDSKMDAADCERTWRNVLQPEINRDKWSEEEETSLQHLVEKYSMRNWKMIAEELGTNRTPFQCLQHYQQHSQVYDNSPWTPEEDELLKEVVETCRFGKDTVHFHQVAYYIEGRSAQMCSRRWEEINPQKKRGRWTSHEDCLLIAAVQMIGATNWMKVSDLVPSRNSQQCRERWGNVLNPELRPKGWSYEEDKELLKLTHLYGSNWSQIAQILEGRTDNNVLQRYKRLMIWKQQCEEFFAMPEKIQKQMIVGNKQLQRKRSKRRGRPAKAFDVDWYKKANFEDYSDVGFLAKQLGVVDEVYDKIIQDKQNNEIVAPRPLPISRYGTSRNTFTLWKRKTYLHKLVESEIMKVIDKDRDIKNHPKLVTETVASQLSSAQLAKNKSHWREISCAMKGKDPNQLSVRELLKISRHIKKTGKAPSDDEVESDVVEDDDDEDIFPENEIIGTDDVRPNKKSRHMAPEHRMRLIKGRNKHLDIQKKLQDVIRTKYKKQLTITTGKHRKYRLFPRKVFESQATEEQEKLRRKSLLLMLKSMDVDSVQAFKKARRLYKKFAAFLNIPAEDEGQNTSADQGKHGLRPRSKPTVVQKRQRPKAEMNETTEVMLELDRELNVPLADSESDGENNATPSKVRTPSKENGSAKNTANSEKIQTEVQSQGQSGHVKETQDMVAQNSVATTRTETPSRTSSSEADKSVASNNDSSVLDKQVQPYNKKLPFIPPNHTNLYALRTLLADKEKLFDRASNEFKVEELRNEFYKKQKSNDRPFVKKLLMNLNPDRNGIRKRQKRKLNNDQEKNSFFECIENVKKSREFNQLKARFLAIFTWPALMSTIKPPKEGQLNFDSNQNGEAEANKDSEKENVANEEGKAVVDFSDEYSSDDDIYAEINLKSKRKRRLQDANDTETTVKTSTDADKETGRERKRRKVDMVELVYKDLEAMGDVEMTEKEELEIMVMNIIARRYGGKKKEMPRLTYRRERGKTLKRLGMHSKMKKLERREATGEVSEEEDQEMETRPKKKNKKQCLPAEPRRSTRLSYHHKPLEVRAPLVKQEPKTPSPEKEPLQGSLNESLTATHNLGSVVDVNSSIVMNSAVTNYTVSTNGLLVPQAGNMTLIPPPSNSGTQSQTEPLAVGNTGAQVATPLILSMPQVLGETGLNSDQSGGKTDKSTVPQSQSEITISSTVGPSASLTSPAVPPIAPIVLAVPGMPVTGGLNNGSASVAVSVSTSSTQEIASSATAPLVLASSAVSVNSGLISTTDSTISSSSVLPSNPVLGNNLLAPGISPFGLFTLPVLPQAITSAASSSTSTSSTASTQSTGSVTVPSLPNQDSAVTSSAATSTTSVTLQVLVGNSIVPVVVQVANSANIGSLNNISPGGIVSVSNGGSATSSNIAADGTTVITNSASIAGGTATSTTDTTSIAAGSATSIADSSSIAAGITTSIKDTTSVNGTSNSDNSLHGAGKDCGDNPS